MQRTLPLLLAACLALAALAPLQTPRGARAHGGGDVAITMRGYTLGRTGANLQETILNTQNVRVATFGKLYTRAVDGQVYGQPLYVPGLLMDDGKRHNVVFAVTQKNKVYAFDADDPQASAPLWLRDNLGAWGVSAEREFGTRYNGGVYVDIQPYVGITSTPAIDLESGTIYVVTFEKLAPRVYQHRLHAFDLTSGEDRPGSPVVIEGWVPGAGADSDGDDTRVTFESRQHLQRAGLALAGGRLYITFAGYADTNPYHGWIFSYDASTLQRLAIYNTTPNGGGDDDPDENGGEGGIWQSGQAPAIDEQGNVYAISGNGTINTATGSDLGIAFIKLTSALSVTDWFIPYDYQTLNDQDADIGSSGAVLIPGTDLVVGGGKRGKIYVLRRGNLGRYQAGSDSQIFQSFAATTSHIHGSIVFWQMPNGGAKRIYVWGELDRLEAFDLNAATGRFNTTPAAFGSLTLGSGMPGGIPTVSANGSTAGSGIVWATHPTSGNANTQTRPGTLRAYNAETLAELWHSEQNPGRDRVGNFAKFNPPTVVDGKVYLGNFGGPVLPNEEVVVYGLLAPSVVNDLADVTVVLGQSATLDVNATGAAAGWSYQWYRGASGDTSSPVAGATGRSYTSTPTQTGEARYWVRVTNQYGSADSASARVIVNKAATTTGIAASASTSSFGQTVAFTATVDVVAPGAGTPTGAVQFRAGGSLLGSVPLDADGTVSLSTAALGVGQHLVSAVYSGDDGFTISNSAALRHTVEQIATSVGLAAAPGRSVFGQTVAFTATVTPELAGGGTPGGTVTFRDGATVLGTAALGPAGRAVLQTAALAPGDHSISATFNGSAVHRGSGSAGRVHTVTKASTAVLLSSSANPAQRTRLITFTAQLRVAAPGGGTPGGTVTFRDGATVLGTAAVGPDGAARLSTAALATGTHAISASYAGDSRYNGASATLSQVITAPPSYRVLLPLMRK